MPRTPAPSTRPLACLLLLALCLVQPCTAQDAQTPAPKPDEAALAALADELVSAEGDGRRREILERSRQLITTELARLLIARGRALSEKGSYDQALGVFRVALSAAESAGDSASRVLAMNNVANVMRLKGDAAGALGVLSDVLALAEASGDKAAVARALLTHTAAHYTAGDYAKALEYARRGLLAAEAAGDKALQGATLNNIGGILHQLGDYQNALEHFRRALALREATNDPAGLSRTLNNIGSVHASLGQFDEALRHFERSRSLKEAAGDRDGISMSLYNVGTVSLDRGDYARGLELLRESLKIREEIGARPAVVESLYGIAAGHALRGEHAQAVEFAQRSAALAEELGVWDYYWDALTVAGSSLRALGRRDEAARSFEKATATIERLRGQLAGGERERQRFFEGRVAPYRAMVALLASEGRAAEALSYAERAKARVLLDVLQSGRADVTKAMTVEELARERQLRAETAALNTQLARERETERPDPARVADLETKLARARLDQEAFETNLHAAHPELRVRRGEARTLRADEALALMPDARTALVEFAVAEGETSLFVLTREGGAASPRLNLRAHTIKIRRDDLAARAEEFRRRLASRDLDFRTRARELYDLLLRPAAAQLAGADAVVLVPDDALWNLPFQALLDEHDRFVVERHAVSYAPSLTVLREMQSGARRRGAAGAATLLAFGNPGGARGAGAAAGGPVTMNAAHAPLPEAERQVKSLAALYGPARSRVYLGDEASEERVKREAANFGVLQFAAHAVLNDSNPLYSHVVLSRGGSAQEDGLLEAREMMNLDLRAEMVVLSACETARGRAAAGEGVIGMSWALFVAGSPTAVVTQWRVESGSATELMLDFHRNLRGGPRTPATTKAQALRQAALRLLRGDARAEFRHPFYWAGFVIVGDAK